MSKHRHSDEPDLQRRAVLKTAGAAMVAGLAASATLARSAAAQSAPPISAAERNSGPLGARLQGVQHFGLTVQNMDRAFAFYTEVLGGTEIMRDGDFQGERIHNTLLTDQEIEARVRQVNPRTMGIPDLRGGAQRLDVRFIQFDNVVIELLQYRDAEQPAGSGAGFAEPLDHMSPAFPRMMHICFHIRDDVDFNKFIADLEAESARRGMTQVQGQPRDHGDDRAGAAGGAARGQQQRHHRRPVERLEADLLQGPRRRAARVRPGARAGEARLRRRARSASESRGSLGERPASVGSAQPHRLSSTMDSFPATAGAHRTSFPTPRCVSVVSERRA